MTTAPLTAIDIDDETTALEFPLAGLTAAEATLLCVADTMVLKVLEKAGKRILKEKRERHRLHGDTPLWQAHLTWPMTTATAHKVTSGEWAALRTTLFSQMSNRFPDGLEEALDSYTVMLLSQGTRHEATSLWQHISGYPRPTVVGG